MKHAGSVRGRFAIFQYWIEKPPAQLQPVPAPEECLVSGNNVSVPNFVGINFADFTFFMKGKLKSPSAKEKLGTRFLCCIKPCKIIILFFLKSKFRDLDLMPKLLAQNN